MDNKYKLTYLAIKRIKELVKEKDKNILNNSKEKLTTRVLREIIEGKIKSSDKN